MLYVSSDTSNSVKHSPSWEVTVGEPVMKYPGFYRSHGSALWEDADWVY
jgi:hypothetical protein